MVRPPSLEIDFESMIVALNDIHYSGPLSVEWEDSRMDRVHGAAESAAFLRRLDFPGSALAFDAAFSGGEADLKTDPDSKTKTDSEQA